MADDNVGARLWGFGLMAAVARRVLLSWLGGTGFAALFGVTAAEAKRPPTTGAPKKQGAYVNDYVDRYS